MPQTPRFARVKVKIISLCRILLETQSFDNSKINHLTEIVEKLNNEIIMMKTNMTSISR
jgi:hypothetical protein